MRQATWIGQTLAMTAWETGVPTWGQQTQPASCADYHDEEYADSLVAWSDEVDQLLNCAEPKVGSDGKRLLQALRRAGPLHNVEAARKIVGTLTAKRTTDTPLESPSTAESTTP
jgi:hypothetical protein